MRYNRVIAAVAIVAALTACQGGSDFDPTPRAVRAGEVVVIAGQPELAGAARDGEYAVQASARSDGGLAVDPIGGQIYFPALDDDDPRVQRIERDGRITGIRSGNPGDEIALQGDGLWVMSSSFRLLMTRVSIATHAKTEIVNLSDFKHGVKMLDAKGAPVATTIREEWSKDWRDARFMIRGDGTPVIVSGEGRLLEVQEKNDFREWEPKGYPAALRRLTKKAKLRPTDIVPLGRQGALILGEGGLIRIDDNGELREVAIPPTVGGFQMWTTAVPLADGSTLLLGGHSAQEKEPRVGLVRPTEDVVTASFGRAVPCDRFDGSLASVAASDPGGVAHLPDGSYVISDKECGRIYNFRLPDRLTGTPYGK